MATSSNQQICIGLGRIDDLDVPMTFRHIPACPEGFAMGSRGSSAREEPVHRVVISDDFWMAETPVTQAQFAVWTQANRIEHSNHFDGHPTHPAENMTWHQACAYCAWLTECYREKLPADYSIATLPTEAQWEYACRAGTTTEYYTGDGEVALKEAGWFAEHSEGSTHPVGSLRASAFGLYDMHGNVWEWCLDRWDATAYRRRWEGITAEDTLALNEQFGDQSSDPFRVLRGGSWVDSADWCRSAVRDWLWAGFSDGFNGFRVCLVRSPPSQTRPASPEP